MSWLRWLRPYHSHESIRPDGGWTHLWHRHFVWRPGHRHPL